MHFSALPSGKPISPSAGKMAVSRLLLRARIAFGFATFFDGFDVLTIAYVMPVIAPLWHLSGSQIGALISVGFLGQLIGALFFSQLAERLGRVRTALATIALFSVASLGCAGAGGYHSLFVMRFIQGIGLGGEMPVAAAYISEISPARGRGRFFMLYELIFPAGMVGAGVAGMMLVPTLGWQSMFILGAIPAPVLFAIRRGLPESPRWLVSVGRLEEGADVLKRLGADPSAFPAQPLATEYVATAAVDSGRARQGAWRELFRGRYGRRTAVVWALWSSTYFITYGLTAWLPTIYRSHFNLPLKQALGFSVATGIAGLVGAALCALLVDRVGRKVWFTCAFLLGALGLIGLALTGLRDAWTTQLLVAFSYLFIAANATLLYLYTPEIYPTRIRAFGVGIATAWLRIASTVAPLLVPLVLNGYGIRGVVALFGTAALLGAAASLFTTETAGITLEELSP